jgi:hypothetical protein
VANLSTGQCKYKRYIIKEQAFKSALKEIGATKYLWDSPAEATFNDYKTRGRISSIAFTDEDVKKTNNFV